MNAVSGDPTDQVEVRAFALRCAVDMLGAALGRKDIGLDDRDELVLNAARVFAAWILHGDDPTEDRDTDQRQRPRSAP